MTPLKAPFTRRNYGRGHIGAHGGIDAAGAWRTW